MISHARVFAFVVGVVALSFVGVFAQGRDGTASVAVDVPLPWADPAHPEIDYGAVYARELGEAGALFRGWWGVVAERASEDEAHNPIVINFSLMGEPDAPTAALLIGLCADGEIYLAYFPRKLEAMARSANDGGGGLRAEETGVIDASTWVATRGAKSEWAVGLRIDHDFFDSQIWLNTPESNGVFIAGVEAEGIMRSLKTASSLTISVGVGGEAIASTFNLVGADLALSMLEGWCSRERTP